MKRIFLAISALLFLSSSTELHELIRIPLLLEHYHAHRSADPHLSLLDFLKIHYSGNHPNDHDDHEDHELPFKSDGSLTHIDSPVPFRRIVDETPSITLNRTPSIHYTEGLPAAKSYSIFHPPRFV